MSKQKTKEFSANQATLSLFLKPRSADICNQLKKNKPLCNMPVPKNAYACNICQKTFDNGIILINHVESRHSEGQSISE